MCPAKPNYYYPLFSDGGDFWRVWRADRMYVAKGVWGGFSGRCMVYRPGKGWTDLSDLSDGWDFIQDSTGPYLLTPRRKIEAKKIETIDYEGEKEEEA